MKALGHVVTTNTNTQSKIDGIYTQHDSSTRYPSPLYYFSDFLFSANPEGELRSQVASHPRQKYQENSRVM